MKTYWIATTSQMSCYGKKHKSFLQSDIGEHDHNKCLQSTHWKHQDEWRPRGWAGEEVGRDHETGKIYIDSWWPVSIHSGEIQLEGTNYTSFKIEQLSSNRLDRRWEGWGEVETSGQSPKSISWDTGWGWTQKLEYYKRGIDNSTEGTSHKMQHRKFTKSSKTQ